MSNPKNLLYTETHEWVKQDGNVAYVGITDYAQDSLGDVVFVELPEKGADIEAGDTLGSIESVKAVSDIYSPVSGTVVEINAELEEAPELLNAAPWDTWIFAVEISNTDELAELLNASEYKAFCEDGEE
ncbi:MAG: glycine cleavage system protein GcvH [Limnochordia bacterium]|jgi:glycine cleavage system H protein|nr:glycine cleavage system protein GcvH [Limnochordia bacterium]MDD2628599.1 glycine cleavage system protein GcvH [Limnochordia bacterium]MDD4517959.1 glycine cleavage system protein GcvH [Limnochordia bacterium]